MRFYLSSFKLGEQSHLLAELYGNAKPVAYIANALDHVKDKAWFEQWVSKDIGELSSAGLRVERLDLREFFNDECSIRKAVANYSGVWCSGGNVFVLRQAMRLSGFDELMIGKDLSEEFTYGGYSAGCCVLSPTLKPYALVDDPDVYHYSRENETIWDGLGILDFAFMPHFQSDHSESALIDREIAYCEANGISYRAFRDGEVLILWGITPRIVDYD